MLSFPWIMADRTTIPNRQTGTTPCGMKYLTSSRLLSPPRDRNKDDMAHVESDNIPAFQSVSVLAHAIVDLHYTTWYCHQRHTPDTRRACGNVRRNRGTYFPLQPMSKSQSVITGKNVVITGGTFNQSVARTELSISRSNSPNKAYALCLFDSMNSTRLRQTG